MTRGSLPSARVLACFVAMGAIGYALNGLGSVLVPLQREGGLDRGSVAVFPSMFALAFLVVGLAGVVSGGRLGDDRALGRAGWCLAAGLVAVCLPLGGAIVVGFALLGLACGLFIAVAPALLAEEYGTGGRRAITGANVVAGVSGVVAPLLVSAALLAGLGWRWGYLVPIGAAAVAVVVLAGRAARRSPGPRPATPQVKASPSVTSDVTAQRQQAPRHRRRAPMTGAAARTWAALVVAVMVEFAYVFWCADALAAWAGVRPELAASAPLLFVGGMTVGRGMATAVANHRAALHLSLSGALLAAGTVVFMLASHPALAALALVAAGLGLAPWYPALLARLIHESADSATGSGWGAVGSGVALLLSPQLLGRLADRLSLAAAFRVVPVLVVVLLANHLLGDGRRTPREAAPR